MTKRTAIEVAYDRKRGAWVVRPFERPAFLKLPIWSRELLLRRAFAVYKNDPPPLGEPSARERAIDVGRKLGRAWGRPDRPCELYIRLLDGTISERETYGRDPKRRKG